MKHGTIGGVTAAVVLMFLIAGSALAGVSTVDGGIEFAYDDPSAGSVSLAGDFNNWNMGAEPLTKGDDGVWRVVVALDPGDYEYKFVVNGSEWIADPDNPRVVGDYGNSGLTVGDDGELVAAPAADVISNTPVNSRVKLSGWYRANYVTQTDAPNDPRLRLNRPHHEFYIGVNPTVTSVASGSAVVRMTTGHGQYKEISADLYSGHAVLEGGPFTVTGFYNEEILQFDNPLETVGHIDLTYTIPEEHIPFGRGAQGIILNTEFFDVDLTATYTNIYDYYIMDNPSRYDNTDTDILAARVKHEVGPVTLGATYTSMRDAWWIGFDNETNYSPHIEDYWESLPEGVPWSTWFELANTETWLGLDVDTPIVDGLLGARAEYSRYWYDSKWDVGNLVKVEGESYSNGPVDIPVSDTDGWAARGILDSAPMPGLDLRLEVTKTAIDSMNHDELHVVYGSPQWPALWRGYFINVKGGNSPLVVDVYDPAPARDEIEVEFDAGFGFGIFEVLFEYDYDIHEWTYRDEDKDEPMQGNFGDFFVYKDNLTRVALAGGVDLADRIRLGLAVERLALEYDGEPVSESPYSNHPVLKDPGTLEVIATAEVGLWEDWGLLLDVRRMTYRDVLTGMTVEGDELLLEYSDYEKAYVAPYIAVVYEPRENIELRVGYGVNPTNYLDAPVEGRPNGRERWLSEYLWEHSDHNVVDAEDAMADARSLGAMAVITF